MIRTTVSNVSVPGGPRPPAAEFRHQPEQPRIPAARIRQRLHAAGADLSVHRVDAAGTAGQLVATAAYVGSQGRNLFLRSVANNIVGLIQTSPRPRHVIREFSIVTRDADGNVPACRTLTLKSTTRPAADTTATTPCSFADPSLDQWSVRQRAVHLGYSKGNTAGSNEALTAANNARAIEEFDYDDGYNNFDVRHTFNLSAIYNFPVRAPLKVGGCRRHSQRAQRPAGQRADSAQRHRLRRRLGQCLQQPGGRPHGGHQHARGGARATCDGRTWCQASIRLSRTVASCS